MYIKEFPQLDPTESRVLGFGLRKAMATGEAPSSVTFVMSVIEGMDATPGARLIGPGVVSGMQVRQRVSGLLSGVTYKLKAVVATNQGSVKTFWGRVTCNS